MNHRGEVGAQEDHDVGDILRVDEATCRGAPAGRVEELVAVGEVEQGVGVHRARRDRVDPHALGGELRREVADHRLESRLRRADGGVVGDRPHRAERGHRHQDPLAGRRQLEELLRDGEQSRGIDVHRPVEVVESQLPGRPQHAGGRVGDDDVEPAPGRRDGSEEALDVLRVGDVALENQGADPARLDLVRRLLGAGAVAEVVDRDVDLEIGERQSDRPTDAAGGAGDQGALAAESEIHVHLRPPKLPGLYRENKRRCWVFRASALDSGRPAVQYVTTTTNRRFP